MVSCCEYSKKPSGFIKYGAAEQLLASQERLYSLIFLRVVMAVSLG